MKTRITKWLPLLSCALLLTLSAPARGHADSGAVRVSYGREFLLKLAGKTYSLEMIYPEDGEDPGPDSPGSAVFYKVRRLDADGIYQEVSSGTADPRKGEAWVEAPDFKVEWSTGNRTSGWLYLSSLPDGTEYCSGEVPAHGDKGARLDPPKWTSVKKLKDAGVPDLSNPQTTYREFLKAIGKCDLDAALACYAYEQKHAEAMRVAVGIFIAHRRFGKTVEGKFGADEKTRELLDGWLRPDVTDKALELTTRQLDAARVELEGGTATVDMRWDELEGDEEPFRFLHDSLRKVDGRWKLDSGGGGGAEDFMKAGGWGNLFRNGIVMLEDASAKITKGDFKNVEELKAYLDEREKVLTEAYEKELGETEMERASGRGGEK